MKIQLCAPQLLADKTTYTVQTISQMLVQKKKNLTVHINYKGHVFKYYM